MDVVSSFGAALGASAAAEAADWFQWIAAVEEN